MLLNVRVAQIRLTAQLMALLNRSQRIARMVQAAGQVGGIRAIFDLAAGYRRTFASLPEAEAVAAYYNPASHTCADNVRFHRGRDKIVRLSDYPVLFHLRPLVQDQLSIFDLGGNFGNLFYCYGRYLDFRPELRWTVCDLPEICAQGRQIGEAQRCRLDFTCDAAAMSGYDVLLISGALHYSMLAGPNAVRPAVPPPARAAESWPLSLGKAAITIQDARTFLHGCKLHARQELISGMQALSYRLIDSWTVPDLSLRIPFSPESSAMEYSGLYFQLDS